MLRRLIAKSLVRRKRQLAAASLSVLLAGTLIAALITLSLGMKSQMGRELEAYGANIVLVPKAVLLPAGAGRLAFGQIAADSHIAEGGLESLVAGPADDVRDYVPYLYAIATYRDQKVVVAGTFFQRLRQFATHWRVEGRWANDGDPASSIIGRKVAQRFSLRPGDSFSLTVGAQHPTFVVAGIADVGGSEDSQIFIGMRAAQGLSDRPSQVDIVQVRASTEKKPLTEVAADIERGVPGTQAKIVGQIVEAQQAVLGKIELLMALLALLALVSSAVAVFSTLSTSVFERTKEIGLMKALGVGDRRIAVVFLAEAWLAGLAGGISGSILGLAVAQAIARGVFDAFLPPQIWAFPITLATALFVATLAALGPVRRAVSVEPIVTLRGE